MKEFSKHLTLNGFYCKNHGRQHAHARSLSLIQLLLAIHFSTHIHLFVFFKPDFFTSRFALRPPHTTLHCPAVRAILSVWPTRPCVPTLCPHSHLMVTIPTSFDHPRLTQLAIVCFATPTECLSDALDTSVFSTRLSASRNDSTLFATGYGDGLCKKPFHPYLTCHPTLLLLRSPSLSFRAILSFHSLEHMSTKLPP